MDPANNGSSVPTARYSTSAIEPKSAAPATHIAANTNAGGSPKKSLVGSPY